MGEIVITSHFFHYLFAGAMEPSTYEYRPLGRLAIRSRQRQLAAAYDEVEREWKAELAVYERGGSNGNGGDDRNYANNNRRVVHRNLFPYHDAFYPLLDAYYHLEEDNLHPLGPSSDVRPENYPTPVHDVTSRRELEAGEVAIPGHMNNSVHAVCMSLLPRYRCSTEVWRRYSLEENQFDPMVQLPSVLSSWEDQLMGDINFDSRMKTWIDLNGDFFLRAVNGDKGRFGPQHLPIDKTEVGRLLTKILKHAISDLQKDHLLGRAAINLMGEFRVFDSSEGEDGEAGVERLGRFLAVFASEYVTGCDWYCHARYLDDLEAAVGQDGDDDDGPHHPNHFCSDWKHTLVTLGTAISCGMTFMSEGHAELIAAFVLNEYDSISEAAAKIDAQYFECGVAEDESAEPGSPSKLVDATAVLKQNLFYHNNTSGATGATGLQNTANDDGGHDIPEQFRVSMVKWLVEGLFRHAMKDRNRLKSLAGEEEKFCASCGISSASLKRCMVCKNVWYCNVACQKAHRKEHKASCKAVSGADKEGEDDAKQFDVLRKTIVSYNNCIRALVAIGEHTIRRLPPNTRTAELGGTIVRSLVLASIDSDPFKVESSGYIGKGIIGSEGKNLICFTRLADAILNANEVLRTPPRAITASNSIEVIAKSILESVLPQDAQDVVRGLFIRDMVDLDTARFGYSDYLVWCGLPITPMDPLLYDHAIHYPDVDDENTWISDEEGKDLSGYEIAARIDFSILMLQRAWNAPWTPQSHVSFSTQHKAAMKTLATVAWKYGMPNEISLRVNAFLPRSWWPDDRKQCWCHDCLLLSLSTSLRDKVTTREASPSQPTPMHQDVPQQLPATMHNTSLMRSLPIAKPIDSARLSQCECKSHVYYCSKEHRRYFMQDGHKRACGVPPFRAHGIEEELLVREVFGKSDGVDGRSDEDAEGSDDDAEFCGSDDESCWESVGSDEEDEEDAAPIQRTRTEIIYKFFNSRSYKRYEVERDGLLAAGHNT